MKEKNKTNSECSKIPWEEKHFRKSLLMKSLLSIFKKQPSMLFGGFYIDQIKPLSNKEVLLQLIKDKDKLNLLIENKKDAAEYYVTTKRFAISYRQETPLNTDEKIKAVHCLVEYIKGTEV